MDWVTDLASEISVLGGRLYLVGGAVRDLLMGKEPHDFDYCVTGIEVGDFQKLLPGAKMHGKAFPVLDFRRREFAFARQEIKTDKGHKGFEIISNKDISIEDDLKRRDITVNSIAMDVLTGEIVDPYDGKQDIERQIIRATSEAFVEDPLRTYRVARFASQLDFRIEPNTYELMRRTKTELDTLSPERVFNELEKALQSPKPSMFFEALKQANVLEIHFTEIQKLIGVIQPVLYHPEGDAYNHTMQVVDKMAMHTKEPHIIFAGLVHDLGKALTPIEERPRHIGHEERGIEPLKNLCDRLKLPTKYQKAGVTACIEHMKAGLYNEMRTAKKVDFIERLSKSALTLEGIEILANADNTKNTQIEFAAIGKEMLETINAKEYPKNMDFNIIKENLRRDRIEWLDKKIKAKEC